MYGQGHGQFLFPTNLRDAIRGLKSLQPPSVRRSEDADLRDRLLERLHELLDEEPARARLFAAGPGDLAPRGPVADEHPRRGDARRTRTRLIDWDSVGVGPATHDLSTLLYRFPVHQRPRILDRYRKAVEPFGWRCRTRAT